MERFIEQKVISGYTQNGHEQQYGPMLPYVFPLWSFYEMGDRKKQTYRDQPAGKHHLQRRHFRNDIFTEHIVAGPE
ncbi:hypothetical protein D3C78_1751140 [compost metagenome]